MNMVFFFALLVQGFGSFWGMSEDCIAECLYLQVYSITVFYILVSYDDGYYMSKLNWLNISYCIVSWWPVIAMIWLYPENAGISRVVSLCLPLLVFVYGEVRWVLKKMKGGFSFSRYDFANVFIIKLCLLVTVVGNAFCYFYDSTVLWVSMVVLFLFVQICSFFKLVTGFDIFFRKMQLSKPSNPMADTEKAIRENDVDSLMNRINVLFEKEKCYLRNDLQINDVASMLYTNKTYISKAINMEVNKSFRDYVNFHRVREAMKLYLENPKITIKEMYERSGFKNYSSFSMAFKLHTGCTPGEWKRNNNPENMKL